MTETTSTITPNFDSTVDAAEFTFRFKKDKLGNQRKPVTLRAGVPSVEGIVKILETGGKGLELLQDALYDVVRGALAGWVGDDEAASQETIDLSKFTWEAIANQPREDRRASSISPEQWAAFAADYQAVMPDITGKSAEAITNATIVYLKKFAIIKTNKGAIEALKTQLALYAENSPNAEEFAEILDLLIRRADTYLKADDIEALVANL
jgi:hypothetical protein